MIDSFTPEESKEFVRLLKKIRENDYWVPESVWQETLLTFPRYACELVIVDHEEMPRILLTRYTGNTMPSHKGHFHIPGGFGIARESIEETCSRVALSELGVDMQFKEVLAAHKWSANESPNGIRPLSLYALCEPKNEIPLSKSCRFFNRAEMLSLPPEDMVSFHPHRAFAAGYLASAAHKL